MPMPGECGTDTIVATIRGDDVANGNLHCPRFVAFQGSETFSCRFADIKLCGARRFHHRDVFGEPSPVRLSPFSRDY